MVNVINKNDHQSNGARRLWSLVAIENPSREFASASQSDGKVKRCIRGDKNLGVSVSRGGARQSIAENKLIVLSNGGTSPNISECNRGGVRALREPGKKKNGKIQSDGEAVGDAE